MSEILVGDKVPLFLQLVDREPGHKVECVVVNDLGKELDRMSMIDSGNGLYLGPDYKMPDVPYIIALYSVQDSDKYEDASDLFTSRPKAVQKEKHIEGQVTKRQKSNEMIMGMVIKR